MLCELSVIYLMTTRSTTGASMCAGAARAARPMPEETSVPPMRRRGLQETPAIQ